MDITKKIEDKFLLKCFYHVGALAVLFPWNPQNGKIVYPLIVTIPLLLAICVNLYLFVIELTGIAGLEKGVIFFIAMDALALILLHLINIYDLVKKRKNWKTLYTLLDKLDDIMNISKFYSSWYQIFWRLAAWLFHSILFIIVATLRYWNHRTVKEGFNGVYMLIIMMQLSAIVGVLLEISLVLKKRIEILNNSLILRKNPYRGHIEVMYQIRLLNAVYTHFILIISNLNSAFGKKLVLFLIVTFISFLDSVEYILYMNDAEFQDMFQEFVGLYLLVVSIYNLAIL